VILRAAPSETAGRSGQSRPIKNSIIMQSVVTKYLGPTNSRGSRIKAICDRGTITIPYPDQLSRDAIHIAAVRALVNRFAVEDLANYGTPKAGNPWLRPFASGGLPGRAGMAHVFID
jgi:hypothetical protein